MRGPRQITLEDKLKAMQEVQRIHALAKTWRSVMPNQKRPNFEAAADAVMRRAMNAQVVGSTLPLEIQDGRMMHEHEPRTARILERTLRNGIIHPDVLHSFQSGRTKRGRKVPEPATVARSGVAGRKFVRAAQRRRLGIPEPL